jgi:hypothetical protein
MARIQGLYPVRVIEPAQVICAERVCKVVLDGQPLYRDDNHLSTFGSARMAGLFDAVLGATPPASLTP